MRETHKIIILQSVIYLLAKRLSWNWLCLHSRVDFKQIGFRIIALWLFLWGEKEKGEMKELNVMLVQDIDFIRKIEKGSWVRKVRWTSQDCLKSHIWVYLSDMSDFRIWKGTKNIYSTYLTGWYKGKIKRGKL